MIKIKKIFGMQSWRLGRNIAQRESMKKKSWYIKKPHQEVAPLSDNAVKSALLDGLKEFTDIEELS